MSGWYLVDLTENTSDLLQDVPHKGPFKTASEAEKVLPEGWINYCVRYAADDGHLYVDETRNIYCHGCGDEILSQDAVWRDGEGYCPECDEAPSENGE